MDKTKNYASARLKSFRKSNYNGIKKDDVNPDKQDLLFTGYFRDGIKRIDVVLVFKDDGDQEVERIKTNFLISAIKAGLELELEPGIMDKHRNLIFIKVHAPDNILEEYGTYFSMKKYFKDNHIQFVTPNRTPLEYVFRFIKLSNEREWIKLARRSYKPPIFSNMERSSIVHRILLRLRFGKNENHYGLNRLLKRNVILDAYALHDGPYFFLPEQDMSRVNARQLLYHYWTGKENWYKLQPFDLIHEYLGDRMSFYYAFFGFYNQALAIAGLVGIVTTFLEIFDNDDDIIVEESCNDNYTVICPACRRFDACPFKRLSEYCLMITIVNYIDNPYTFYYCLFVALWAIMFIAFWKRKENYWIWMWELNQDELKNYIRPEFQINHKNIKRSKRTGIIKNYESIKTKVIRITLTSIAIAFAVIMVMCINASLVGFKYWLMLTFTDSFGTYWSEYISLGIFGIVNVVIIIYLENTCKIMSYKLTDYENHRTQDTYERSLVIKLYGFTFAFTFAVFLFFAYIKGGFYTYPADPKRWYFLWGFGVISCNPMGCLDEVWLMMIITIFAKQVLLRILRYVLTSVKTDYNEGDASRTTIPCWEKEYRLEAIDEKYIVDKYRDLVTQFGLVTLFVAAFPLAPFFALIVNIWDVRYNARLVLLTSRRPLLSKCTGLGAWRDVLVILAYCVALTNALTLSMTTKTIERYIYLMDHNSLHGFLNWTLSVFEVADYMDVTGPGSPAEELSKYTGFKPEYCSYSGFRKSPPAPDKYMHEQDYWFFLFFHTLFIIVFEHFVVFIVMIMHYVIPDQIRDIKDTIAIEERLKNVMTNKNKSNTDYS